MCGLSPTTKHKCRCIENVGVFDSQQSLSFHVLSTLLSASSEWLPDAHVLLLFESLRIKEMSRVALMQRLDQLRKVLPADHVRIYPAKILFSDLDSLPRGTLISLALMHGLSVQDNATRNSLRASIAEHISMGSSTLRETAYKSISCSSIVARSDSIYAPGTERPSTRLCTSNCTSCIRSPPLSHLEHCATCWTCTS
jgi:hypothetical protein